MLFRIFLVWHSDNHQLCGDGSEYAYAEYRIYGGEYFWQIRCWYEITLTNGGHRHHAKVENIYDAPGFLALIKVSTTEQERQQPRQQDAKCLVVLYATPDCNEQLQYIDKKTNH